MCLRQWNGHIILCAIHYQDVGLCFPSNDAAAPGSESLVVSSRSQRSATDSCAKILGPIVSLLTVSVPSPGGDESHPSANLFCGHVPPLPTLFVCSQSMIQTRPPLEQDRQVDDGGLTS